MRSDGGREGGVKLLGCRIVFFKVTLTGCPREAKDKDLEDRRRSWFGRNPTSVWDAVDGRCLLDIQWRRRIGSWVYATEMWEVSGYA